MKRSAELTSLSRDHHKALVVARELSRVDEDRAEGASARFVQFLAEHELGHFAVEESVLLPVVPDEEPGPQFVRRLLEDHEALRSAMRRLERSPDAASVDFLHEVGDRLRAHVMMEEREFFPYLERSLDRATLKEIGTRLSLR
jgi:hemerythrin-like domain-containing protein